MNSLGFSFSFVSKSHVCILHMALHFTFIYFIYELNFSVAFVEEPDLLHI
jgi:hypothetical protein